MIGGPVAREVARSPKVREVHGSSPPSIREGDRIALLSVGSAMRPFVNKA